MTLFPNRPMLLASCVITISLTLSACGGSGSSDSTSIPVSGNTVSGSTGSTGTGTTSASSGSTGLAFDYSGGFASASPSIHTSHEASFQGSAIQLIGASAVHQAGAAWYTQQQNIQSFTTDFTFQMATTAYGMTFTIQNSAAGLDATADANGLGYGVYSTQTGVDHSVAIKFDTTSDNSQTYLGATPSSTGLYLNGGPLMDLGFVPENDLVPASINLASGHIFAAHVVYDGSILTMVLKDTSTGTQTRVSWPVDIPTVVGSSTAYIGFTAGTVTAGAVDLLSWSYSSSYATQLSSPTFSATPGRYSSAQTVSLSADSGATIYYTTNGQAPTTSSTRYAGPISVDSSEVVQAIAVESGHTDSPVAVGNYQIASAGTPIINFPSGFASASNFIIPVGTAKFSGSQLQLTDGTRNLQTAAAWYAVPVNVRSFTTSFTLQMAPDIHAANGMTFVLQNQNPASTDSSSLYVTGGPAAVGYGQGGLGYQGLLNSVAIKFDPWAGSSSGNLSATGLYLNGATPGTANLSMIASGLSLWSGNPYSVTMTYDGTTLAMTVTDTVTHASFSNSWNIDIPGNVGGNTAYVGFTAGMGYVSAAYNVLSWTYAG